MTNLISFPGLGLSFSLNRVVFSAGPITVYWYGIIVVTGILLGTWYAMRRAHTLGLSPDRVLDVVMYSVVVGVIGARIYYVAFTWDYYKDHLNEIIRVWEGGIAFYGGVIAGVLCAWLLCRIWKQPLLRMTDICLTGLLLGQGIGRWGNFVNVEAFGSYYTGTLRMVSPHVDTYLHQNPSLLPGFSEQEVLSMTEIPVHPTFLYESAWLLLGFLALALYTKHRRFNGELTLLYLLWNGLGRMVIEGLRTDSLMLGTVRVSQVVAFGLAVLSFLLLLIGRIKARSPNAPAWMDIHAPLTSEKKAEEAPADAAADEAAETEEAPAGDGEAVTGEDESASETAGETAEAKEAPQEPSVAEEPEEEPAPPPVIVGKRIDGKAAAETLRGELRRQVEAMGAQGIVPGLAVVLVGDDPASRVYAHGKQKACEQVGVRSEEHFLPETTTQEELLRLIADLNASEAVDGILVEMPLPKHINAHAVSAAIDPAKDVDCCTPENIGRVFMGEHEFAPCTPSGCMELLDRCGVELKGKHCVVIGRSNFVGKPMAMLLMERHATITICHSRTVDLPAVTREADVLVSAVGKPKFVTADMVKEGAVVLDVGINRDENGKLCGDVDYDAVEPKASLITPAPGGVGPMTVTLLLENTVKSAQKRLPKT